MALRITRRAALKAAAAGLTAPWSLAPGRRAPKGKSSRTASRPSAISRCRRTSSISPMSIRTRPKGGVLSLQIKTTGGNQNFDTFDTLNIYSLKGDGAAGMSAHLRHADERHGDEPDSLYGLVARAVRYQRGQADLSLPPAPRGALPRRLAADRARCRLLACNILKAKGHPTFSQIAARSREREAEGDDVVVVRFVKERSATCISSSRACRSSPQAWWKSRDFDALDARGAARLGRLQGRRFEQGRFIEFERVAIIGPRICR